jgi:glycosyltransferase involved in cell wall biosynthesis
VRICFDGQGLAGNLTGAGKAFAFLLRQLQEDFPQHEYTVLSPGSKAGWRLPQQLFWEQVRLPFHAVRLNAHILHVPGGASAPILRRRKLVMTVHDIAPTRHPEFLPSARSRWYWGKWIPFTARLADCVIVPSVATKQDLVEVVRISADRIHVIPLGVTLNPTEPVSPAIAEKVRSTHHLPDQYLLYVGTIDRRKDYKTLLEALHRIEKEICLVVVGTLIKGRTDFPQLIERLGLTERVRILGYVPDQDLPVLYKEAAVFVYPSFYEGFGLPVLEAMACGTPVITYNTTSLPEVVGEAGILLDLPVSPETLAAQIVRLMEDDTLRLELVARGIERAARFNWRATANLTVKAYEALLL